MQIVCSRCGIKNRVPDQRLRESPKCGKCRAALLPAQPVELRGETFSRVIEGTELPILVDFWAEWCGPCKMMAPIFEQAARERPTVLFAKVNTEIEQGIAANYQIRSIPTLVLFRNGREATRLSGAMPAPQLLAWLDSQLN